LITGVTVFLFKSDLTIIANLVAFLTFMGSVVESNSSLYVQWLNGLYSTIVSAFSLYYDTLNSEVKKSKKEKINYVYWIKIIGIPFIVVTIFVLLYKEGNPKFDTLISTIDFSFINLNWIFFTVIGYYLLNNITNPIRIEPLTHSDIQTNNTLNKMDLPSVTDKNIKSEALLGTVLLASLNALIILFLITDILHLSELHSMIASELSKQVHTGVNALIASNLLAIVIILYFYRGNINFYKGNTTLKKLTFVWILLNISVIAITAVKNMEYIISFGLTYKRIGVLLFLIITSIGLITTFLKVLKIKNLWYLLRKNTQVAFAILVLSSVINWDKVITYYNIRNAEQLDLEYLIDLSNNNAFILKDYVEKNDVSYGLATKINTKHREYLYSLEDHAWQEMLLDNFKIKR
jgi:hypothetical protein